MTRHRLRVDSALLGLLLAGLGTWWLVDHYAWLTDDQLGYAASAILIVVGVLGVALTLRRPAPDPLPTASTPATEGRIDGQEADPQP